MTDLDLILVQWEMGQDVYSAKQLIRDLVYLIGVGFHPDTRVDTYVNVADGQPVFTVESARRLQSALEQGYELLTANGIDPCEVALPLQQSLFAY